LLVRGVKPKELVDDREEVNEENFTRPDEIQQRAIKIRRGQAKFRESLLAAYRRTCAVTGCKVVDLLEAAHIRPHADEPNYRTSNGLLLRADIHTLFDVGLLAVDSRYRVRVAPALLSSDYKIYHEQELKYPEFPSDMPSSDALERRYKEFKGKHNL
jgi:predicted restriction endonuclease